MKDIIKIISGLKGLKFVGAAPEKEIYEAEKALNLKFSNDYIDYVKRYGAISACGIELTGITCHKRLDVVYVTKRERLFNPNIPPNMYVIENIAIDGFIILQNEAGKIYAITKNKEPRLIFNTLYECVENSVK